MDIAPNRHVANYCRIVSAAGWCSFFSIWLDFAIHTRSKNKMNYKKNLLLYIPAIIFFINTLRYDPNMVMVKIENIWGDIYPQNYCETLFKVYYVVFFILGITMIYKWGIKSKSNREKKQSRIVIFSALITFFLGVLTDVILPIIGMRIPLIDNIFVCIFMLGVWYAVSKYKMMTITPEYVSNYIFRMANDPIFFIEDNFAIKNANEAALKMTGYNLQEIEGNSITSLFKKGNLSFLVFYKLIKEGNVQNIEVNLINKKQYSSPYELSGTIIYDEFKDMLGIVIILHDISERKNAEKVLQNYNLKLENSIAERTLKLEEANLKMKNEIADRIDAEEKIRYMVYYDELTDLPNRRYFKEAITKQIKEVQHTDKIFAIMYLDLDNFKLINDTFGHQQGDNLLKYFVNCMNKVIRKEDVLSRIGGDEFLILVRNLQKENFEIILNMLSQDIMSILNEPFLINGSENFITASIGVACYPVDGEDSDTLVMNADIAMYEAKSSGRNNVKICSSEIKAKVVQKTRYRSRLYRAVKNRELMIYYQPQVNVTLNKIIGFEALLRWKVDNKSFVSPSEFIPILEETGLIVDVGYWVIENACIALKRCHNLGANDLRMAINLSANQLNEKNFISKVMNILNDVDLEPVFIEFEITERITLNGDENIKKKLEELKRIGISISIDDFGTEYSSFRNLKKLPIDKIKIDMEFVQGINKNEKDTAIVSSIIELCHRLGLDMIAEGVETTEQLKFLENKCCDKVQGYLYYKPIPEDDMEKICKYVSLAKVL